MIVRETYCAKCGSNARLFRGLCDDCHYKLKDKFERLRDLSYDAQKEMAQDYGVSDAEHALVIKKYGPAQQRETIICNRCKCTISESGLTTHEGAGCGTFGGLCIHLCDSCQRESKKDEEERHRRD